MIENNPQLSFTQATAEPFNSQGMLNAGAEALDFPISSGLTSELSVTSTEVARIEKKAHFSVRPATIEDIDAIVEVDLNSFESVYSAYDKDSDELRSELRQKFAGRFETLGGNWMPVLEKDGEIVGFMNCCPTSKSPEEFQSWEETTGDGTLNGTYDPEGNSVYVVTLSVMAEGSLGKDMLFAHQIGKATKENYQLAYFESRMPGLKDWVLETKCDGDESSLTLLTDEQKDQFAEEYFGLHDEKNGKQVRHDKLLRLYERIGCKCLKVLPDAYQDEPSMNYGVVCVYNFSELFDGSYLPVKIPENKFTRKLFGSLIQASSRSVKITRSFFGASDSPEDQPEIRGPENKDKKSVLSWMKNNKLNLAIGASVLSLAAGIAFNPVGKTLKKIEMNAEWVVPAEIALDGALAVGASMMVAAATGVSMRHPYKNRGRLKDVVSEANNTTLFRSGFALSTVAGLSWGGVAIGSIISYLPPEAWGALSFPGVDLASTVVLRKIIWSAMQESRQKEEQKQIEQESNTAEQ